VDSVKRGVLGLKENGFIDIAGETIVVADVEALRKLYRLIGMREELGRG
jgi:hypothetical protein